MSCNNRLYFRRPVNLPDQCLSSRNVPATQIAHCFVILLRHGLSNPVYSIIQIGELLFPEYSALGSSTGSQHQG